MDFGPIIQNVLSQFWYLIPLFILAILIKTPWFKGVMGETIINLGTKLFLDRKKYHLLHNVTLPTADGTTQIDHIIVSRYGIFVVETKNMKGWIFGSPNQPYWTQKIFKHTCKFQNPLRQNYKHVVTLAENLSIDPSYIYSVVVFVGDCDFKTPMPDNVCYPYGYIKFVKSKQETVLSEVEVNITLSEIRRSQLEKSWKTNRAHVRHVKEVVEEKCSRIACPKCGSGMTLREAKKGQNIGQQFWGCNQFPKCRGVMKYFEWDPTTALVGKIHEVSKKD